MDFIVTDFSAGYGKKQIVSGVSFCLESGTLTALLGTNGCGKTTLLKGLCHLAAHSGSAVLVPSDPGGEQPGSSEKQSSFGGGRPGSGNLPIRLDSCSSRQIARHVSYIAQKSGIHISLPALEVVLMGFQPFLPLLSSPGKSHRASARLALQTVGLAGYEEQDFLTLSEGQKQLCILARALVQNTELLLFDEPDSALDYPNRHKILNTIHKIVYDRKKAGLLVLHDLNMALDYCDQLLLMKNGTLIGTLRPREDSEELLSTALCRLYGPVRVFRKEGHCFIMNPDSN